MNLISTSGSPFVHNVYDNEPFEYLLIAHPDKEVNEKVMAEKEIFYDDFKERIAVKTQLHITVASFHAKESMEDTIIRWMQKIFVNQQSFPVTLNNYSGFPPHTIYLRIQNATPFHQLAKELKVLNEYISSCSCPPMKLISKPHLSIAGKLPEEIYFRALAQYAHKSFHESFMVNELLLLKRSAPDETCKKIYVFAFHQE
jgi:2'-5' RNA ligase